MPESKCEHNNMNAREKSASRRGLPPACRAFEGLLAEVAEAFNNATQMQYAGVINENLGRIARFLKFDRSTVMLFDSSRTHLRASYGWARKGVWPPTPGAVIEEDLPWYASHIRSGQMILLKTVSELPPEAVKEREFLLTEGIQSSLTIPLVAAGVVLGAVSFGSYRLRHHWLQGMTRRFRLIGEILTLALEKHDANCPLALPGNPRFPTKVIMPGREQLRRLALHLMDAERQERRRIAETLHENIMQTLAAAVFMMDATRQEGAFNALTKANRIVRSAIHDLRALVTNLHPSLLYQIGLNAALRWLANQVNLLHGVEVKSDLPSRNIPMDEDLRVLLYEAARQLLLNAAVHGRASRAVVRLRRIPDSGYRLTVIDNGSGFDTKQLEEVPSRFFGLFALREKAQLLGGSLRITSRLRLGTHVSIMLPQMIFPGKE